MPSLDFHCRSEHMTNFSTEEHLPTPRYGPYLTHAHNHITIVVAALIGANLHGIAIGIMNVKSRVGVTRASGLKWVLSETCSEEYMTKKAVKMRDLTHVSYSLLSSGS